MESIIVTCVARVETIEGTYYRFKNGNEKIFRTNLTSRQASPLVIGERYNISPDTDNKVLFQNVHRVVYGGPYYPARFDRGVTISPV